MNPQYKQRTCSAREVLNSSICDAKETITVQLGLQTVTFTCQMSPSTPPYDLLATVNTAFNDTRRIQLSQSTLLVLPKALPADQLLLSLEQNTGDIKVLGVEQPADHFLDLLNAHVGTDIVQSFAAWLQTVFAPVNPQTSFMPGNMLYSVPLTVLDGVIV